MIVVFDRQGKRITDFGSNANEMNEELWLYLQERFNLTETDVLIGELDADFAGKDLSQMVAVITNGVVTGWNAPDYVPPTAVPQPPTQEERLHSVEDAITSIIGL